MYQRLVWVNTSHFTFTYGIMTEELVIREIRFTDDEFRGHYAT